jgi:hypothetical protein
MPKSRRRKPKPNTARPTGATPKVLPGTSSRWWTIPRKLIAGFAGIVAFAAAAVTFLPRVAVDPDVLPDMAHGSLGTFKVKNAGLIPLEDITIDMGLCSLSVNGAIPRPIDCQGHLGARFHGHPWHHNYLRIDDAFTIGVGDLLRANSFNYADISWQITYKPWFLPWTQMAEFRFTTQSLEDGTTVWYQRPSDE